MEDDQLLYDGRPEAEEEGGVREPSTLGWLRRHAGFVVGASILTLSVVLGLATETNGDLPAAYGRVSNAIGWLYFLAWSCSFYPQVVENYLAKETSGLNPDYLFLNLVGYVCYSAYSLLFFLDEGLRRDYRDAHGGDDVLVTQHDVFFACHALLLTSVQVAQCLHYDGRRQLPSRAFGAACGALLAAPALWMAAEGRVRLAQVYFLSYEKMAVTALKYLPQLYHNYARQSTAGWSFGNILLDLTGGVFSSLQLLLDAAFTSWAGVAGDPVKLGLGVVSVLYDLLFIAQHLYYSRRRPRASEVLEEAGHLYLA